MTQIFVTFLTAIVLWFNLMFAPYQDWLRLEFYRKLNGGI